MRLFLDTEFNGQDGELISIALVSDDNREWYRINAMRDEPTDPWVAEHVIPKLYACTEPLTREHALYGNLAIDLKSFLYESQCLGAEIIADWPADFEHFASLLSSFGAQDGFKEAFPCTMTLINTPELHPEVQHNALSDARALRDWYVAADERRRKALLGVA